MHFSNFPIKCRSASEKKKAFSKYTKKYTDGTGVEKEKERIAKYCTILRAICHTSVFPSVLLHASLSL